MKFYTLVFGDSEINRIFHQEDGTFMHATFTIKGQTLMCTDSAINHEFIFTPAISLFVACETVEEIDQLFNQLSQDGQVLMPLSPTPVSEKLGWVGDKFGVAWQLNLAKEG